MKKYLLVLLLFMVVGGFAQTQELEQLKLNLEKLAQLKLMLARAKQGYQTLQNGYNSVRDATKGNFDLHKKELDRLLTVSAQVKASPAIRQIRSDQMSIENEFTNAWKQYSLSGLFTPTELSDLRISHQRITEKVSDDIQTLSLVLTADALRMSDQERLNVVFSIQQNLSTQLSEIRLILQDHFKVLALRSQQKKDNHALRKLKGIN